MTRVLVCDPMHARLAFVSATTFGRTVTGREVCWRLRSLMSGEERTLQLRTRLRAALPPAGLLNCARATARGVRVQRACARFRGAPPPSVTG